LEKGTVFKFRGVFLNKHALKYQKELKAAFATALTELGMGAKTAVGYGRFKMDESSLVKNDRSAGTATGAAPGKADTAASEVETWEDVSLTFAPGNQEVTARAGSRTAFHKGKEIIPDAIAKKFFKNKRGKAQKVTVEPIGNRYRIISITP
jgi:CRISPR-associated protein Cmr6